MKTMLRDVRQQSDLEAIVTKAEKAHIPYKKAGWQFSWRKLYRNPTALFYKVSIAATPDIVKGMLMLSLK